MLMRRIQHSVVMVMKMAVDQLRRLYAASIQMLDSDASTTIIAPYTTCIPTCKLLMYSSCSLSTRTDRSPTMRMMEGSSSLGSGAAALGVDAAAASCAAMATCLRLVGELGVAAAAPSVAASPSCSTSPSADLAPRTPFLSARLAITSARSSAATAARRRAGLASRMERMVETSRRDRFQDGRSRKASMRLADRPKRAETACMSAGTPTCGPNSRALSASAPRYATSSFVSAPLRPRSASTRCTSSSSIPRLHFLACTAAPTSSDLDSSD